MGRSALRRTPDPASIGEVDDRKAPATRPDAAPSSSKPPSPKRAAAKRDAAAPSDKAVKAKAPKGKETIGKAANDAASKGGAAAREPKRAREIAKKTTPPAAVAKKAKKEAASRDVRPASSKLGKAKADPAARGRAKLRETASGPKRSKPRATAEAAPRPAPDAAETAPSEPAKPRRSAGPDHAPSPYLTPEVEAFANNAARLWEVGGAAFAAYFKPREQGIKKDTGAEVAEIARTLGQVAERWMSDPARVAQAQKEYAAGFLDLWTTTMRRLSGEAAEPTVLADPRDARFKDPEWSQNPIFDFLKQAYLHTSRWADRIIEDTAGDLDPHLRHKASFYVKLLSNAVSPSNFVPTNPELLRETISSKGENLVRGMKMLAEDLERGGGDLRVRQTDPSNFEVGKNLAVSPGKVVFRNELFELIQYAPATVMARSRPVLIVPPWINKFYVLDLTPEKSLMQWAVSQGLTMFCISWVNPDGRHAAKSFDDYMRDGVMKAVDVAREIAGAEQVDAVGYCVGGTLLAVTAAYMAAKDDRRIASATLLTTQVDFTHAGDLAVFVDEEQIAAVEARMADVGYLEGASMANAFNLIRSNDMIFPYLVNNYLKGKAPFPFDLLYWNSDATRMPAANHSFYLRGCYLNNDLARGRMEIAGETLDLARVTIPIYELAAKEDHIAPARSVFLGAQLFGGPVRFVLAGSGHIAGVVNPPAKMKYQHWVGGDPKGELTHWLDHAEERPGSWWPDWRAWLAAMDATMVEARVPGEGPYPALEDAPGSYVRVKS